MMSYMIKKSYWGIVILLLISLPINAVRQDRHVVIDTVCNCSLQHFQKVVDMFFLEFQTDPDHLFTWAYLNTDGDGNTKGKDAIVIKYVHTEYNPLTREGDQTLDIYVLGSKMFPNRHLGTINHGNRLTATYSGSLLEDAEIRFDLDSVAPAKTTVHYEVNFVFGKFLSLFITDKNWATIGQWRFGVVLANIINYAETKSEQD